MMNALRSLTTVSALALSVVPASSITAAWADGTIYWIPIPN